MQLAHLSPQERREIWKLLKRRTGLSDQELRDLLLALAADRGDRELADFARS